MAIRIASLFVGLTADDRDYRAKLVANKRRTREWEKAVTAATDRARASFRTLGVGVGVAGAAFTAAFVSSSRQIDELAKNAAKLGDTSEALTAFGLAAELSGNGADQATVSLQRMTRRLSEAAQGSGEAKNAIAELGLDAQRLASLRPSQAFEEIQGALAGIPAQGDRVRLAFKFFDSEGVGLVNTTRKVLQLARDDVEALGGALSKIETAAVEEANDSITRLGTAFDLTSQRITANFAPSLKAIADQFFENAKQTQQFQTTIDDLIKASLRGLSTFTRQVANVLGFLEGRQEIAEFGVLGYLLFGKKGAAIGSAIGLVSSEVDKTFNSIKSLFVDVEQADRESLERRLASLQKHQARIEDGGLFGSAAVESLFSPIFGDADEVSAEIADIESKLIGLGDTTSQTSSFVGSASNALHGFSDALALASGQFGVFNDEVGGNGAPLIPPAVLDNIIAPNNTRVDAAEQEATKLLSIEERLIAGYQRYAESRVESDRIASQQILEIRQKTIDVYQQYAESRQAANDEPDFGSYFAQQAQAAEQFQQTWTDFNQAGAADRFSILSGEIGTTLSTLGQYNKSLFNLNKAAGIANAVINTAQGITKALASLPPPASFVAAGAVAAAGAVQILSISQAQFGSATTPSVSSAPSITDDVSSTGDASAVNIESGDSSEAAVPAQYIFNIVSADELIDRDKFAERAASAVAEHTSDHRLQFDSRRGVFRTNVEAA